MVFIFLTITFTLAAQDFYMGADLSYVNEMEDCGVIYHENQVARDPYAIFSDHGVNLARYRLWYNPAWTDYSTLADVKTAIGRAKAAGMDVLLDFHYSNNWADPSGQRRPEAWDQISDLATLGDSLYNYTYRVLAELHAENLTPQIVQTGNEVNGNILLLEGEELYPVDWERNISLFNRAMDAIDDFNSDFQETVKTMIHIAKPETAEWWFGEAANHGFTRYDMIGISYYPGWSEDGLRAAATSVSEMIHAYNKEVMIVETGYPWTLDYNDNAANSMGEANLLKTHDDQPSPEDQASFLTELTWLLREAGASGMVFWEPDWVSNECYTQWGQGSHWENVALFDFDNNLHAGAAYLDYDYAVKPQSLEPVEATFKVDMTGVDVSNGVFVTGDFTGTNWQFMPMEPVGDNIYSYTTTIPGRSEGAYIFQNNDDWAALWRETVPAECALYWGTHREYVTKAGPAEYAFVWGSCTKIGETGIEDVQAAGVSVYPNPAHDVLSISTPVPVQKIELYTLVGDKIFESNDSNGMNPVIDVSAFNTGVYLLQIYLPGHQQVYFKIFKK